MGALDDLARRVGTTRERQRPDGDRVVPDDDPVARREADD